MGEADRARHGGIRGLVALLDEHYGAVEADLARYYGPADQLGGIFTGALTYRRLWALIQGLPIESAAKTALRDATPLEEALPPSGHGPWSREMYLIAEIYDAVSWSSWQWAQAHSEQPIPKPEPMPRPGVASAAKPVSPSRKRHLDMVRANHGAWKTDGEASA